MSVNPSYEVVLRDLEARRQRCADELKTLEQAISGVRLLIAADGGQTPSSGKEAGASAGWTIPHPHNYGGVSVRWAILYMLAEHATGPMGTADIAEALREGGITTSGKNFTANVSAVLSGMMNKRGEVEQAGKGYQLTEQGRKTWAGIKQTPEWLNRGSAIAS